MGAHAAAGFTIPTFYFNASRIGQANAFGITYNNWENCFTALNAPLQPDGCPDFDNCTRVAQDLPFYSCSNPGNNLNDQFFYWRRAGPKRPCAAPAPWRQRTMHSSRTSSSRCTCLPVAHAPVPATCSSCAWCVQAGPACARARAGWGSTGGSFCGDDSYVPYLGRKGPYLNSNDTQGAWIGSAMNATCSWLGLNQNITLNGQRVYQRGFQCKYGMQARVQSQPHSNPSLIAEQALPASACTNAGTLTSHRAASRKDEPHLDPGMQPCRALQLLHRAHCWCCM